jgi:hypothetical protein
MLQTDSPIRACINLSRQQHGSHKCKHRTLAKVAGVMAKQKADEHHHPQNEYSNPAHLPRIDILDASL